MRAALAVLLLAAPAALALVPAPASVAPAGLALLRGDLHAHTCYSDGEGAPADAFAAVKAAGRLDFFAVTDHSEWLEFPFCADEACVFTPVECLATSLPARTEWEDTLAQAEAATDASFVGLRGFEWSHPAEGHANVLGSSAYTNFLATPAMAPFYAWLLAPPPLGGSDGVASFNHPGREPLTFDGFAHVPPADAEMQLLEVYNRGNVYEAQYVKALDQGWHVAATGVSDSHGPSGWLNVRGQTLVLAEARTRGAILAALDQMRTAATNDRDLEVVFEAGGHLMGASADLPDAFVATVRVHDPTDGLRRVSVLTRGGAVAASLDLAGERDVVWQPTLTQQAGAPETWFFVKVEQLDGQTAHTAPIWAR